MTRSEDDRVSKGEGAGVDGARQLAGGGAMEAHAPEVAAEARLEERALGSGQWLSTAGQRGESPFEAAGERRCHSILRLRPHRFFVALGTHPLHACLRHAHHLVGHAVGLALGRVTRGAHRELRLRLHGSEGLPDLDERLRALVPHPLLQRSRRRRRSRREAALNRG
ncbi:MAG: hypothetical protein ACXW5U_10635 [Thermoanaerobaculia bacterium]